MTDARPRYHAVDEWIAATAVPFAPDAPATLDAAVDAIVAALGPGVELLGFGEAIHGGEALLQLRNRLFQRLVEAHGYSAIALECSFPRSLTANDYVTGRGDVSLEAALETGISHGFGKLAATRELLEWMHAYNTEPAPGRKLHFYGFDMPALAAGPDSPRRCLEVALDFLAVAEPAAAAWHRGQIQPLLGPDERWGNPMDWFDPTGSAQLIADARALRLASLDLISELRTRRPALGDDERWADAVQHARVARGLLQFFATLGSPTSYEGALGVRDLLMADNLADIVERERGRGKVLAFAHNTHLQRGMAEMQGGPSLFHWWPAGAQLAAALGDRYAVVGTGVGVSEANGIGQPEPGTLEALLTATPGPVRCVPTFGGQALPADVLAALPQRSRSAINPSYVAALGARSFADFDWLVVVDATDYARGGPPLQPPAAQPG